MNESRSSARLMDRPVDLFFVLVFAFFAFSSFCSDALHGLHIIDDSSALGRMNEWYIAAAGDDFMAEGPKFARLNTLISAFVYGPFYVVLALAFVRGWNWIRLPAILYVGAMLHGYIEFMWWELTFAPPRVPAVFWAFNAPYGIAPLLLLARVWRSEPFRSPRQTQKARSDQKHPESEHALAGLDG